MKRSTGQIALVVLIISAISLTLGLALADRVRTDIKTDTDDEQLQRAFNAAESGVENYLVNPSVGYTGSDGSWADVTASDVTGEVIEFGEHTVKDHYAYFWLVGHNGDDSINESEYYDGSVLSICYNKYPGAFAVYYFRNNNGSYDVVRKVYNLTTDYINNANNTLVDSDSGNVCGDEYQYQNGMNFSGFGGGDPGVIILLAVIRPLGGGSRFAIKAFGDGILPSQGEIIDSTGRSGSASTTVSVYKRWDPSYYMSFLLEGLTAEISIN